MLHAVRLGPVGDDARNRLHLLGEGFADGLLDVLVERELRAAHLPVLPGVFRLLGTRVREEGGAFLGRAVPLHEDVLRRERSGAEFGSVHCRGDDRHGAEDDGCRFHVVVVSKGLPPEKRYLKPSAVLWWNLITPRSRAMLWV